MKASRKKAVWFLGSFFQMPVLPFLFVVPPQARRRDKAASERCALARRLAADALPTCLQAMRRFLKELPGVGNLWGVVFQSLEVAMIFCGGEG